MSVVVPRKCGWVGMVVSPVLPSVIGDGDGDGVTFVVHICGGLASKGKERKGGGGRVGAIIPPDRARRCC